MRMSGKSCNTFTARSRIPYEPGKISDEAVLKLMPSMTPVNFFTSTGSSSGQPSSSLKPFTVSGASGHLSREPRKPSPSESTSGQPSSSSMPLRGSGWFGHLSTASGTPSLSLSGSGQPSSSSKPSRSSAIIGHLSAVPEMPSPSGSEGGGGGGGAIMTVSLRTITLCDDRSTSPKLKKSVPRIWKSGPPN